MRTNGWGRYPEIDARIYEPVDSGSIAAVLKKREGTPLITKGAGRSYGDSSLAATIISSRFLDNFIDFDVETGVFNCACGVTLEQVLEICVPAGWTLPVLPGTRFVTTGGAIAGDVHGKNHHLDGCFSNYVQSLTLMLASGETVTCSRDTNRPLFEATCGGMGLTGVILSAELNLEKITSAYIEQHTFKAANLDQVFDLFEDQSDSKYSVAWIDCLAQGAGRGRSILFTGKPAAYGGLEDRQQPKLHAPSYFPAQLINQYTIRTFNRLYYILQTLGRSPELLHYKNYFFPLDWINNWNRLYGRNGFIQYQFVVPEATAKTAIDKVLTEISSRGKGSFLSVLKKMGPQNSNLLSFPLKGYTLALDFKYEKTLLELLNRLDEIVLANGGRLYLCKDARMSEDTFKSSYTRWQEFEKIRTEVDPDNLFASLQSNRLGLGKP